MMDSVTNEMEKARISAQEFIAYCSLNMYAWFRTQETEWRSRAQINNDIARECCIACGMSRASGTFTVEDVRDLFKSFRVESDEGIAYLAPRFVKNLLRAGALTELSKGEYEFNAFGKRFGYDLDTLFDFDNGGVPGNNPIRVVNQALEATTERARAHFKQERENRQRGAVNPPSRPAGLRHKIIAVAQRLRLPTFRHG